MSGIKASEELPTRERVLRIAASLFAARGFHAVGMAELGDAVGLGRGALYHHIRSKEDLLYDISRGYIADLAAHAKVVVADAGSPGERLERLGDYLIEKIASRQAELTVCFREVQSLTGDRHVEVMAHHAQYEGAWKRLLQEGEQKGVFRPYDPIVLKGLLGMYFYSYLWMKPSGRVGPKVIAARFNSMALKALAAA
jgi:AcrR family transcriptional regulator